MRRRTFLQNRRASDRSREPGRAGMQARHTLEVRSRGGTVLRLFGRRSMLLTSGFGPRQPSCLDVVLKGVASVSISRLTQLFFCRDLPCITAMGWRIVFATSTGGHFA